MTEEELECVDCGYLYWGEPLPEGEWWYCMRCDWADADREWERRKEDG